MTAAKISAVLLLSSIQNSGNANSDRKHGAEDVERPPADLVGEPAEQRQADQFQQRCVHDGVEHQLLGEAEPGRCVDHDEHGEHVDPGDLGELQPDRDQKWLGVLVTASPNGLRDRPSRALSASNTGVSGTRDRTKVPSASSTMLTRNGMRQP